MANGDGVLTCLGEEKLHQEGRGTPRPCSTVPLAKLRRGLQGHQYLTPARKLGLESEVPQALSAVNDFSWSGSAEKSATTARHGWPSCPTTSPSEKRTVLGAHPEQKISMTTSTIQKSA
jgi:hypothetical protein